jgi:hypothetical protein
MNRRAEPGAALKLVPEAVLALAVLASFVWVLWYFSERGFLPQPFLFVTNDTFMDWFNTAHWANNPGAYSVWHSVYPPISFVYIRIFSLPACHASSVLYARECDWLANAAIVGAYVLVAVLAACALRRADRRTAPFRTLAFALGMPTLYTLERGNLIMSCLVFFIIAYGELSRAGFVRWMAMAVTINFKPYLLIPVLALALKRRWRAFEMVGFLALFTYLVTLALYGSGTPFDLLESATSWINLVSSQVLEQVYYSTSYAPLLKIEATHFPLLRYIPSETYERIVTIVPIAIRASQALTVLCAIGAWLQPEAISTRRLAAVLLAGALASQSPGGYTLTFLLFLVFMEPWQRPGPIAAIVAAYLLSITYDSIIVLLPPMPASSWLGGRTVVTEFGYAVGQLVRPGLVLVILWGLALDSLHQIARAHRLRRPALGLAPA